MNDEKELRAIAPFRKIKELKERAYEFFLYHYCLVQVDMQIALQELLEKNPELAKKLKEMKGSTDSK